MGSLQCNNAKVNSRISLFCAIALLLLAGCGSGASKKAEPVKQYPMRGEVLGLDKDARVATIKHEKIEGFMDAMTMGYPVKDQSEFNQLKTGEHITATVNMQGDDYWVSGIKEDTAAAK